MFLKKRLGLLLPLIDQVKQLSLKGGVYLNDEELNQLKESIETLDRKVDTILSQSQRPKFLWREFWIGFGVVFVIIMGYSVVVRILQG